MFEIGIIDHLEGPSNTDSRQIYNEVADLVKLADSLGIRYAFFAEHHAHAHHGHLPTPPLFALHLASQTKQIHLGTAVTCLNLHDPLDIAEQFAVADVLTNGRIAPGFGSGSTDEESILFNRPILDEPTRHAQFFSALQQVKSAWSDSARLLPKPSPDLAARTWLAVNSPGAAQIAGQLNFNMLFSHLRTVEQYHQFANIYHQSRGTRKIAANRPIFVAETDEQAARLAEPALRTLWRRFQSEGKIPKEKSEPTSIPDLCTHPINFFVGSPATVAEKLRDLRKHFPFDILNVEVRWDGLSHEIIRQSLQRLMQDALE